VGWGQGRRQVKKCGVDTFGERGARAYNGGLGAEPQRGPGTEPQPRSGIRGQSPPEAENLLAFGCPTEAANLPHSPYLQTPQTPGICDTSVKKLKYRPRWHGQYCVSAEKQFGIVVLVMCEVALQSKSAHTVAPNVCRETPLNHNSYTPAPSSPSKKSPDLRQSQEQPLAKVEWTCPPQSTPWRRPRVGKTSYFLALCVNISKTV